MPPLIEMQNIQRTIAPNPAITMIETTEKDPKPG